MQKSRAESFGERPLLTLNDLRKHTDTMEKVNELLERQGDDKQVDVAESKEEKLDTHLGDLQKKLHELDKKEDKGTILGFVFFLFSLRLVKLKVQAVLVALTKN